MKQAFILLTALAMSVNAHAQTTPQPTDSLERQLQEVVVTARQPVTKLVGSTLVSTIAGSNLANLGTALDVLAQLPLIRVDGNAVSVLGKSNIEIYIDGRPMRSEHELAQLLSSNLKRVELLMAPGAAYASTTGAVLRITTRRSFMEGLSVTNQTEVKRSRRWAGMEYLNPSYRAGNWELFASGVYNHTNSLITGTTVNSLTYKGEPIIVGSSQESSYPTNVGVAKAGVNYANGAQSFGAYYSYNPEQGHVLNSGTEWFNNDAPIARDITRDIRSHGHSASTYYENKFADKYLLHFDGDFHTSLSRTSSLTAYPTATHAEVRSTEHRQSTLFAGKLYLELPLWSGTFTTGTQQSHTRTTLYYQMFNPEVSTYIPSSLTDARQTSAAAFATWSRTFSKLNLTAGARYEYVDYAFKINGQRSPEMSRRNHLLTPDLTLGYNFTDDAQLTLSYKMATVKPSYSQLTGALTYTGLHEIEGGNPSLRDERSHTAQLFGLWRDFMVQTTLTRSIDTYAFVKQLHPSPTLQLLLHPVNINVTALNLYLIWNRTIGPWTPDLTLGLYRQWLRIDSTTYNRPILSYYFNNTLSLPSNWTLTANINGSSSGDLHTNSFAASWFTIDASLGKTLLNNALTLRLSATDLFNTSCNSYTISTYGITLNRRQSYNLRSLSLTLIYNLHPRPSLYKGTPASATELNRL